MNQSELKPDADTIKKFWKYITQNDMENHKYGVVINGEVKQKFTDVDSIENLIQLCNKDNHKGMPVISINPMGNDGKADIKNVTRLKNIVIDIDVQEGRKQNGISTKKDKSHLRNVAFNIKDAFNGQELPNLYVSMIADSGNGYHIYIPINIEIVDTTKGKLVHLQEQLKQYNDEIAKIDCITQDLTRKVKVIGTWNVKGNIEPENYRLTCIVYEAEEILSNKDAFIGGNSEVFNSLLVNEGKTKVDGIFEYQENKPLDHKVRLPCVKNAYENGIKKGERNSAFFMIGSDAKIRGLLDEELQAGVIEIYNNLRDKTDFTLEKALRTAKDGYNKTNPESNYRKVGCNFIRSNTSLCLFYKIEECDRERLLMKYGVLYHKQLQTGGKGALKVKCPRLGDLLLKEEPFSFITIKDETNDKGDYIMKYENGFFDTGGERIIKNAVQKYLNPYCDTLDSRKKEVLNYIKDTKWIDRDEMDSKISKNHLNVRNGVVDITKVGTNEKELLEHSPNFMHPYQFPVYYRPELKFEGTKIQKAILKILPEPYIPVYQEFLGLCLYWGYPLRKIFFFYGTGGNGKSVLIDLACGLLGDGNFSTQSAHALSRDKWAKGSLYRKHANICGENASGVIKDFSTMKDLSGGNKVTGENKFQSPFEFENKATLGFAVNKLPEILDKSQGALDRTYVIPFLKRFKEGEKDTILEYGKYLCKNADEMSALLNWAIDGLNRVLKNGKLSYYGVNYDTFRQPHEYFIKQFINGKKGNEVDKVDLYKKFLKFCEVNYIPVPKKMQSTNGFTRYLEEIEFKYEDENGKVTKVNPEIITGSDGRKKWVNIEFLEGNFETDLGIYSKLEPKQATVDGDN